MIFIAHRGNLFGPDPANENKPEYLLEAISKGFYVETDLWVFGNRLFLGHNIPQYEIEIDFLLKIKNNLFCHCKNINALYYIIKHYNTEIECFFHNNDECVLTSKQKIWNSPGKELSSLSICVMPEIVSQQIDTTCFGVCSDFIFDIKCNSII